MRIDKRPPNMAYLHNSMIYKMSDFASDAEKIMLKVNDKIVSSYSTTYIDNISIDVAPILRQMYDYIGAIVHPMDTVTIPGTLQTFTLKFELVSYKNAIIESDTYYQEVVFGRATICDKQADKIENYTCYTGLPFTFYALFQTPTTINGDPARGLCTINTDGLFGVNASISFSLGDGFQFTDHFTPEFHMSGTAIVNVTQRPIPCYDWVYLRWLDNHGGTYYHMFKKLGSKTKIKESSTYIDNVNYDLNTYYEGVNEGAKLLQPKESRQTTVNLVSLQTTYQEAERLRTLVASDVVYMHTVNGWYRVQIGTTDFETPDNDYSDLTINIVFND